MQLISFSFIHPEGSNISHSERKVWFTSANHCVQKHEKHAKWSTHTLAYTSTHTDTQINPIWPPPPPPSLTKDGGTRPEIQASTRHQKLKDSHRGQREHQSSSSSRASLHHQSLDVVEWKLTTLVLPVLVILVAGVFQTGHPDPLPNPQPQPASQGQSSCLSEWAWDPEVLEDPETVPGHKILHSLLPWAVVEVLRKLGGAVSGETGGGGVGPCCLPDLLRQELPCWPKDSW